MNIYQQEILDKYQNPQHAGKPENFTYTGKSSNLSCGDEVEVFITANDGVVSDIHYIGEGCIISLSSAEILAENLKDKPIDEIRNMKWDDVMKYIGIPLTSSRIKCAMLPYSAVQKALESI